MVICYFWLFVLISLVFVFVFVSCYWFSWFPASPRCCRICSDTFRRLPVLKNQRDQRTNQKILTQSHYPSRNARKRHDNLMFLIVFIHFFVLYFWFVWSLMSINFHFFPNAQRHRRSPLMRHQGDHRHRGKTIEISRRLHFRSRIARTTQW